MTSKDVISGYSKLLIKGLIIDIYGLISEEV